MPEQPLASRLKTATTPIPSSFFSTLITANHVLHSQSVVDGYGHVSARSPQDPSTFYLSSSLAPALVSSRSDLVEYRVSDGSAVQPDAPPGYAERFIHSEIYKKYPDVHAVVHAHSEAVVPFGVSSVPLRPVFHMGGVMGPQCPVYDITQHYASGDRQDLLVSNARLGESLARGFNPEGWVSKAGGLVRSFVEKQVGLAKEEDVRYPANPVVLMRGHGFTAVGTTVEEAVYRSVYTVVNARVQRDAILLQGAWNTRVVGERVAKVTRDAGYQGGDKEGSTRLEGVAFLTDREGREAWEALRGQIARPWALWVEEVRRHGGFYRNEYWERDKGA